MVVRVSEPPCSAALHAYIHDPNTFLPSHVTKDGSVIQAFEIPTEIHVKLRPAVLEPDTEDKALLPLLPLAKKKTNAKQTKLNRWQQVRSMMHKLTRGMKRDSITVTTTSAEVTSMLHKDFWLEALDDQHRYGFHLRAFHKVWKEEMIHAATNDMNNSSFFYWLDHGNGSRLDLPECSQEALHNMNVMYCSPEERKQYELRFVTQPLVSSEESASSTSTTVEYVATHQLVHTDDLSKWIFVLDQRGKMYIGRKRKGYFHHSSFVAGEPIRSAGKIMIKHGQICAIEPHSGHFKPTLKNLRALCQFLEAQHVDLTRIVFIKPKKWACPWPFAELDEETFLASDTDYDGSYRSDSEETGLL